MSKNIAGFIQELPKLPLNRAESKEDFYNFIKDTILKYADDLREIDKIEIDDNSGNKDGPYIDQIFKTAANLNGTIIRSLQKYLDGSPGDAYTEFSKGITKEVKALMTLTIQPYQNLFRIRVGNQGQTIVSKEIFHIPMNEREKVASQRFSISGLPCLYLSSSLFLCWSELNKPEVARCHAARFKVTPQKKLVLLNLSNMHPVLIRESKRKNPCWDREVIRFLSLWPLIAACSIKVKTYQAPFKPEYIIPQLLLQFIRKEKTPINGVKYSSTHYDYYSDHLIDDYNVALPIKSSTKEQYCEFLTEAFELTPPISWEYFNIVKPSYNTSSIEHTGKMVKIYPGEYTEYSHSVFGIMEHYLTNKELIKIDCDGKEITKKSGSFKLIR